VAQLAAPRDSWLTGAGWRCADGPFKLFRTARPCAGHDDARRTLWVEDGGALHGLLSRMGPDRQRFDGVRPLKDDLSETVGEPTVLFHASEAAWSTWQVRGNYVSDAPYLHKGKTGKLYMIWASHGNGGYNEGMPSLIRENSLVHGASSRTPLLNDGVTGYALTTFDGKLMMVLHSPNGPAARPRIFECKTPATTLNGRQRVFNRHDAVD